METLYVYANWKSLALQIGIPHSEIENLGFIAAHK